jgi:hypothetical protein
MTVTIRPAKNSAALARGEWRVLRSKNRLSAMVRCPRCGAQASLLDHDISAGGAVTPSIDCPTYGCGFHEHVSLEGWGREHHAVAPSPFLGGSPWARS